MESTTQDNKMQKQKHIQNKNQEENQNQKSGWKGWDGKSSFYVVYMFFFLSLMDIFDSYSTIYPPTIISQVQGEFLSEMTQVSANSTMAIVLAIASLGTYFALINQYLSDLLGRKIFLFISMFGMGVASLFVAISSTLTQFTAGFFMMYLFFSTDMFIIYISEESPKERRGMNINIIMIFGCLGSIAVPILRSILITDTSSNWRTMSYFAVLAIPLSFLAFGLKETTKFTELKKLKSSPGFVKKSPLYNLKKPFVSEFRKEYISMLVISFFLGLNASFVQLGELFLSNHENMNQSRVNTIIMIMGGATVIGFAFTGYLADKFGRKKLCYIYAALMPISILIIILGIENPNIAMISCCIGAGLASISYYGLGILNRIVCMEILPTDIRGIGASIRSVITAVGITVGLLINSWLNKFVGLGYAFFIMSLLLLIGIPILHKFVRETRGIELKLT
ncbi:MAG: MFS transporter [Promethearchaeota archaeon]